jgi:hypothetical protein
MKNDPLDTIMNFVSKLNLSGENIVDKANNTDYNDVLRLRMQAAERGIEMTPQEVVELIELLREAGS